MTNQKLTELLKSVDATREILIAQIRERDMDWQHLVSYGLKAQAITAYYRKHGTTLKEAKDVVDAFAASIKEKEYE